MLGQLYWIHIINCIKTLDSVSHDRRKTGKRQFLALESPNKTNISDYKYLSLHEDWLQVSEYNYCIETQ